MKEFWSKVLGLTCSCYEGRKPEECTYIDKTQIVQPRDTLIINMGQCLTRPLMYYNVKSKSIVGDYSYCLQAKVWPKDLNEIVKLEFFNWEEQKDDIKYYRLSGMILKESSQNVLAGHYMAAVRHEESKWFHLDDESVQPLHMSGPLDHRKLCYPVIFMFKLVPTPIATSSEKN